MSKLNCKICHQQMSDISSGNDTEGVILRDCADAKEDSMNSDIRDLDVEPSLCLWECWSCGALAVGDDPIIWYRSINADFRILKKILQIKEDS